MVIKLEEVAISKIKEIISYHRSVAGNRTAENMRKKIETNIDRLLTFPNIGPIEQGINENQYTYRSILAHPNYKIIYRIEDEVIYIVTIWDCRQDPKKMQGIK